MKKPVTAAAKQKAASAKVRAARSASARKAAVTRARNKATATHAKKPAKPVAKKVAARKAKKATLGGKCAWEAFGVPKPRFRRGPAKLSAVAKRAGYVRGRVTPGAVVGLYVTAENITGYHACRVLSTRKFTITVDLWGVPTAFWHDEVIESYVPQSQES